ncbi:GntR family transcriptional regulator [Dactylosporangium roseum]|uniref:GntR family transcriptional regulator n=1 Tax=Dactylosporangium roseum TaxID=47989 RepID=A0ABY5YZL0_9ACTN|nr:GntR family transcriptional regulator [Dactylosporangium roseum]UWZ34642.1 GntR family transcriptional regulator [Dactylosporangium roseum]
MAPGNHKNDTGVEGEAGPPSPRRPPSGPPVWDSILHEIVIDRQSAIPPVEQVQNTIRHKLATGRVPEGTRLPSARRLAAAIGVTSATVGRAYAALQGEGLLASAVGVGTTVVDIKNLEQAAKEQMERAGSIILDNAIKALRRIGYSTPDLRRAMSQAAERLGWAMDIVFIGARGSSIETHVEELRKALADELPVSVFPVFLDELESGVVGAVNLVERADLILTPLVYKRYLVGLLGDRTDSVLVMMSELSRSVTDQLLNIEPDARVLLLSKPLSRSIALGILQEHGLREQLDLAGDDLAEATVREHCRKANVVVHTTDLTELVQRCAGSMPAIALSMTLRTESIEELREYLRASQAQSAPISAKVEQP